MNLRVIVPATTEPVTLAQAKYHLGLTVEEEDGAAHEDDAKILRLIRVARQAAENYINRPIALATYEWRGADLGAVLPVSPIESVAAVEYIDETLGRQTLAPEDYVIGGTVDEPCLRPEFGVTWPSFSRRVPDAVRVLFVAGYGVTVPLPETIHHAVQMLVQHYFDNPAATATDAGGGMVREIPLGPAYLLNPHRIGMGV